VYLDIFIGLFQGCFTKQNPVSNYCYLPDHTFTYALPQQLT
jgi:hypothetical protein